VRKDIAGALRALVLPTLALVVVVAFIPGRVELVVRIYALVVCAAALALALAALRRAFPPETPLRKSATRASSRRQPPSSLGRIEHEAALSVVGSFDLHYRLVPRVRAIASGLLAARRRIELDKQPDAARKALGEETWEIVRPDRPPPEDRLARGISSQELGRVVDSLERI
jgi:hypothetical protein